MYNIVKCWVFVGFCIDRGRGIYELRSQGGKGLMYRTKTKRHFLTTQAALKGLPKKLVAYLFFLGHIGHTSKIVSKLYILYSYKLLYQAISEYFSDFV